MRIKPRTRSPVEMPHELCMERVVRLKWRAPAHQFRLLTALPAPARHRKRKTVAFARSCPKNVHQPWALAP